jgi:hypothetical protein
MGVINSSEVYLNISTDGGKTFNLVAYAIDAAFNSGSAFRDVTTKYSGGNRILIPSKKTWSLSTTCFVVFDADGLTPVDLFAVIDTRQLIFVEMMGANAEQDFYVVGRAYLTAAPIAGGTEDNQQYTASLEGLKYMGASWSDYLENRAASLKATVEAVACVEAGVKSLRQININ